MEWYDKVKELMIARGIKQVDIANRRNLPPGTINRYLKGGRGSDKLSVIQIFAEELDVPVSYLINKDPKLDKIFASLHKLSESEKDNLLRLLSLTEKLTLPELSSKDN